MLPDLVTGALVGWMPLLKAAADAHSPLLQAANLVQHGQSCVADYLLKVRKFSASPETVTLPQFLIRALLPAWHAQRAAPANLALCGAPALVAGGPQQLQ